MRPVDQECQRYRDIMLGESLGDLKETTELLNYHQSDCVACKDWTENEFRLMEPKKLPKVDSYPVPAPAPDIIKVYLKDLRLAAGRAFGRLAIEKPGNSAGNARACG